MQERIQELRQRLERSRAERERIEGLTRDVQDSLRRTDLDAEVLRKKLDDLAAARPDRRRFRRAALHARWGKTIELPSAREELTTHGRRMARLRRLQYLVATERQGEARTQLMTRVGKLIEREEARHDRAMKALEEKSGTGRTPSGTPSSPPAPSAAPSGVAP